MKVMTARVVNGKIDVGDADLEEGAVVAVLISGNSDFGLSAADEKDLAEALEAIQRGEFTDGKALLDELRGTSGS